MTDPVPVSLTPTEQRLLAELVREERRSLLFHLLGAAGLAMLFPIIPSRHNRPWPPPQAVYWKTALILGVVVATSVLWSFFLKINRLKRDLHSNSKVIQPLRVKYKERSRWNKTFTIFLETEEPDFKSIKVSREEYDRIRDGQHVTLEYAPHSKYLFRTIWHG